MNIRETGSIDILKAIVHVIDQQQHSKAQKSEFEIDVTTMDAKVKDFIHQHVRLSIKNSESKLARYEQRGTNVQRLANGIIQMPEQKFVENSQFIADWLYLATPANATPGCIVVVLYTNSTENFLGIIKLDKNEAISYELNKAGYYELVPKGTTLPLPSRKNKLLKFAALRDSETITDQEWNIKPGLIVLDKQVEDFSHFFYKRFLSAEFLLTDDHKSEKLMEGLTQYLKVAPEINLEQKQRIMKSFKEKLVNNEEFTLEDAAQQIFSAYYPDPEKLQSALESLESTVIEAGMGDTNLRGVMTPRIEKRFFGTHRLQTVEDIQISYPDETLGTTVIIEPSKYGDGEDILIKNVHIKH
ncbi:nucleoid-associated protein [Brevibacillus choshinensis]|uniref:nucleoid-associated protein n=1 Tax=Brevibacillus choshinensis TaxID=54911 RepID=UPI002E1A58EA|nr:nucleoid-associated protein [Brevibacillus choshinensis]MED4581897.1 nucleoid-associated protein [Brevibacillus choshinensis]